MADCRPGRGPGCRLQTWVRLVARKPRPSLQSSAERGQSLQSAVRPVANEREEG